MTSCQRLKMPAPPADCRGPLVPCGRPATRRYNNAEVCHRCYNVLVKKHGEPKPIPAPDEPVSPCYNAPIGYGFNDRLALKERVVCERCGQRFSRVVWHNNDDPNRTKDTCLVCGGSVRRI